MTHHDDDRNRTTVRRPSEGHAWWQDRVGGLGFIGGALARSLMSLGVDVHTVSRSPGPPGSAHRHWQADLSDEAAVARLVAALKPQYVFHLASHVVGAPDLKHVMPAFKSNLQTTVNPLSALADVGCTRMITPARSSSPRRDRG